jgi:hypothetical protein
MPRVRRPSFTGNLVGLLDSIRLNGSPWRVAVCLRMTSEKVPTLARGHLDLNQCSTCSTNVRFERCIRKRLANVG